MVVGRDASNRKCSEIGESASATPLLRFRLAVMFASFGTEKRKSGAAFASVDAQKEDKPSYENECFHKAIDIDIWRNQQQVNKVFTFD